VLVVACSQIKVDVLVAMNIGIAGAGLIGRLLGWQLLRRGHRVTLFDRDQVEGHLAAARVAAAMLAPFSEVTAGEREVFEWGVASLERWPELLADLKRDSGIDVFFQRQGSVVVAHKVDRSHLDHFQQLLRHYIPQQMDKVRVLNRDQLIELEPELTAFDGGVFLDDEGTLDNRELLNALVRAIRKLGGEWHANTAVDRVDSEVIECSGERFEFDLAIDARGVGAKPQLHDLRGVRGEVLWVHAPEVNLTRPVRLMHPRYQLYIAPKRNHVYVIGATQIESESLAPITVRSSLELQSALYSVHTGFAEASVLDAFANLRPAFLDNLPRIDTRPGLLRVNGLYRHGYLLSPFVLDLALQCIDGDVQHAMVRALRLIESVGDE
jgi:glycine oxidase